MRQGTLAHVFFWILAETCLPAHVPTGPSSGLPMLLPRPCSVGSQPSSFPQPFVFSLQRGNTRQWEGPAL